MKFLKAVTGFLLVFSVICIITGIVFAFLGEAITGLILGLAGVCGLGAALIGRSARKKGSQTSSTENRDLP